MSAPMKNASTSYPMTCRSPNPTMASTGSTQNGCSILATCSPYATPIAVMAWSAPSEEGAGAITGPCTTQCPPPEGTNMLMIIEEIKDQNGRVAADEKATKPLASTSLSPLLVMMPIKPP